MELKRLPIGVHEFPDFKEDKLLYIDKTEHIHRLVTRGKYYFLSRPRRFGNRCYCQL
jgi:Predicted AAA-ATPase